MTVHTETHEETYTYIATDVETLLAKSGFELHTSTPYYRAYTNDDLFVHVEANPHIPYVEVSVHLRAAGMPKVGSTSFEGYQMATAENVSEFVKAH